MKWQLGAPVSKNRQEFEPARSYGGRESQRGNSDDWAPYFTIGRTYNLNHPCKRESIIIAPRKFGDVERQKARHEREWRLLCLSDSISVALSWVAPENGGLIATYEDNREDCEIHHCFRLPVIAFIDLVYGLCQLLRIFIHVEYSEREVSRHLFLEKVGLLVLQFEKLLDLIKRRLD